MLPDGLISSSTSSPYQPTTQNQMKHWSPSGVFAAAWYRLLILVLESCWPNINNQTTTCSPFHSLWQITHPTFRMITLVFHQSLTFTSACIGTISWSNLCQNQDIHSPLPSYNNPLISCFIHRLLPLGPALERYSVLSLCHNLLPFFLNPLW